MGADNFSFGANKEGTTMKDIILQHIKKISELSCQELTPSYWQKKPMKIGDGVAMAETYSPDKRLAYINAIEFLNFIVTPICEKNVKEFKLWNEFLANQTEEEQLKFKIHKEEGGKQDDWYWTKLEISKRLFARIVVLLQNIKYFEAVSFTDSAYDDDDDDEDEKGEFEID